MISKVSTAVQNYLEYLQKRREEKKWPAPTPFEHNKSRKEMFRNQEQMPLEKGIENLIPKSGISCI